MNTPSPDHDALPEPAPHPIERRLQGLRPQPLGLDAESIVAAAGNRAPEETTADRDALRPPAPAMASASHPWSLAIVGISGFAAGILLTYVVMSRSTDASAPPLVVNPPAAVDNTQPASEIPPSAVSQPATSPKPPGSDTAPLRPSPPDASPLDTPPTLFNTATILAVRGSQPRNDLAGLSDSRSRLQRHATPILQPTRYRDVGIPAGATPNQLLDELLGPL